MAFQSPSILKYLVSLMGNLFTTRFADCIFNKDHFRLYGEIINLSVMARKLFGMISLSYSLTHVTHVQRRLNFKFKKL
jgi:hypothetical protein